MNWYLVKLIYQIKCSNAAAESEFDEQIRLITAEDHLHAFQKARLLGDKETYLHTNCSGTLIEWRFIDVTEIHLLDSETDGAELYSRIALQDNADMYIRSTRKKALQLFDQVVENFTG